MTGRHGPPGPGTAAARGTILVEEAKILGHRAYPGAQHILRVRAPGCAARALPGSFAHLRCDTALPMRRPLSIMRVSRDEGWVQFLYKVVGDGTRLLAGRRTGETLSLIGPIGTVFRPDPARPRPLLLGGGVGIPPIVFLADALRQGGDAWKPLAVLGSEVPFPFRARPSSLLVAGLPDGVIAAMPLLEEWGIPSRLTSLRGFPGCHQGFVTDLARHWLASLAPAARDEVEIFACGPEPMLAATADLAREFGLPCQLSLEEYMACAVGGCAGCVVRVTGPDGPAMKRVCVDGPVFDAAAVYPGS